MSVLFGILAGWLGGSWHLAATALRARAMGSGNLLPTVALLPVALAGPVLAVAAMVRFAPEAVWAVIPGLMLAKLVWMRPLAHQVEAPWTR